MRSIPTRLPGPVLIEPSVHRDARGSFFECGRASRWTELGIAVEFVQENQSRSARGVIRGLHLQVGEGQAKLVRCVRGVIWDVVVDVRRGSPTRGRWEAFRLDTTANRLLFVPVGFAHGFLALRGPADVHYRCSAYHDPALERTIAHDDPDVAIPWPGGPHVLSARDRSAPRLREVASDLPFGFTPPAGAPGGGG